MPAKIPEAHRRRTPVLIINSYAGSLTVAASALDHPIIGSYEDAGYGIKVQMANFGGIDFRAKRSEWPEKQDLSSAIVIAHPPCAAFSYMNTTGSDTKRGLDAEKFQCTIKVLDYAMGNRAKAIAIESVIPAMNGARDVHDGWAEKHGYQVFRILQNACTFGVPQWRERFWVIFVRNDQLSKLVVQHLPTPALLRDVLDPKAEPTDSLLARKWYEQLTVLNKEFGWRVAKQLTDGTYGYGRMGQLIRNYLNAKTGKKHDARELAKRYAVWGNFDAQTAASLNPNSTTPVLLQNSFWTVNGRVLNALEYQRVMGFPDGYAWPGKTMNQQRGLLSRGVCPPVAAWILDQLERNLNNKRSLYKVRGMSLKDHSLVIEPGGVVDLRPSKQLWAAVIEDILKEEPHELRV